MMRVCVGAVVVDRTAEPRLLLGKRSASRTFFPGVWDVLGGHSEHGETPEQTLVRELQEEAGIGATAWRPLVDLMVPVLGDSEPMIMHLFEVNAWTGTPRNRQPDEHDDLAWFTIADACALPLALDDYAELFRRLRWGSDPTAAQPGS